MRYLVILDAGHGLDTPGKRTPLFNDGFFMKENEFNRDVVRKIDLILEKYENIDVIFTTTEKRDISLDERVRRANDIYDRYKHLYDKTVLISVHANAMTGTWDNKGANGTAAFYYPTNMVDKAFAEIIQKSLIAQTKLNSHRGGVVGENFQIIRDVKMTASLCECAFMDNLAEAELLRTVEFRQACAEGIVDGLKECFNMADKRFKVEYSVTKNRTYQLRGEVKDFGAKIVNKGNRAIEEEFCTNGTFFWRDTNGNTYSTSILYANGVTYQYYANHLPCPQSVFIIYKDNTVAMKRLYNLGEIDLSKVRLAIGGVGLFNADDPKFKYDLTGEGFIGAQADVARKTFKTVIGYNKKENKIYLMCRPDIYHKHLLQYDLIDLVKDCEYDIALSVDGGGSTFMNNATDMVLKGDGRKIHNIIGFGL